MPLRHRTHSAAIATAADWIFNYMIVQITPIMITNISWHSYIILFVLNLVFAVSIYLFFPETSGRSLEEMDLMFLGDRDRVFMVDRKGQLRLAFRSQYSKDKEK
jgi:hypothetical protein